MKILDFLGEKVLKVLNVPNVPNVPSHKIAIDVALSLAGRYG